MASATARLRDLTGTRRAPPVEEVRAGRGKIRFPTINLGSVNRGRPVAAIATARAPVRSVQPSSRRVGGAGGALLALGAAAYLAWSSRRRRGSRVSDGMTETAGERELEQPGGERAHAPANEPVQTGAPGIGRQVLSRGESIDVPVTHEAVFVERRPMQRRPADRAIGEGETFAVPMHEERAEVEQESVMYEAVSVGERPGEETEPASSEVRRQEARIEGEGDVDVHGDEPRR